MKKNKIIKLLFIIILILLSLIFIVKYIEKDVLSIEQIVGTYEPIEVSMNEYYTIKQNILGKYFDLIKNGEYDIAYLATSKEYKEYKKYEDYINEVKDIDFDSIVINSIKMKNTNMYLAALNINNEDTEYIIYINDITNTYSISPDKFIKYKLVDKTSKNSKLKYKLNNYIVKTDENWFDIEIENTGNTIIEINSISMIATDGTKYDYIFDKIGIAPKEVKKLKVNFITNYKFPQKLEIETKIKDSGKNILNTLEI